MAQGTGVEGGPERRAGMWLPTPFGRLKQSAQRQISAPPAAGEQCLNWALRAVLKLPSGVGSHIGRPYTPFAPISVRNCTPSNPIFATSAYTFSRAATKSVANPVTPSTRPPAVAKLPSAPFFVPA